MSRSLQSGRQGSRQNDSVTASGPKTHAPKHAELWRELIRQRTVLLESATLSLTGEEEQEPCSDLADQASTDREQDLAIQVKTRIMEKLGRIERALQLMRTHHYGRCRRCREDIPYERLKVQPDALFCVPCLTVVEQAARP